MATVAGTDGEGPLRSGAAGAPSVKKPDIPHGAGGHSAAPSADQLRLVAAVVARGGVLRIDRGRLACRLPAGAGMPPGLAAALVADKDAVVAALTAWDFSATVRHIQRLSDRERAEYRAALAHDLAALAEAEAGLARCDGGGEGR